MDYHNQKILKKYKKDKFIFLIYSYKNINCKEKIFVYISNLNRNNYYNKKKKKKKNKKKKKKKKKK